jgi:hypothetical protein
VLRVAHDPSCARGVMYYGCPATNTIGNVGSFIDANIFIGLGYAPMNIWVVRFDFDPPHVTDEYMGG